MGTVTDYQFTKTDSQVEFNMNFKRPT